MEFIGESVEQALEKARQYFGSDELEYEVISEKRGLLRNEVVIKAWVVSPESVAEQLVTALLKAMGKTGSVHAEQMDDQLHISVDGEDLGILIGKHGSFLDTFEGFVRYIIRVRFPEIAHVDVDVMNYKQKRIRQLEDMVEQSVQKTKRTKRPVTLPPMLRWERREVHRIVSEKYPAFESKSTGYDPNRRVQIFLKTAGNSGEREEGSKGSSTNNSKGGEREDE
ncbi:MAG TPA: R3H domain-containing nucleic acid-binding protein [Coprothermobacter proteolyticus]|uniref:Jag family protein n=1 Tax=Coprothermobacter proteolyticus TaxID=35786 RepID=UPI000D300973|nr:R3H domain-containing nucleic acid-binding protein [Coprothermobacter proteolyticus]HPZ45248.1 R3H domain-containing nucleic acid-binding protein [Coprothermobacter proteolyticus]